VRVFSTLDEIEPVPPVISTFFTFNLINSFLVVAFKVSLPVKRIGALYFFC